VNLESISDVTEGTKDFLMYTEGSFIVQMEVGMDSEQKPGPILGKAGPIVVSSGRYCTPSLLLL
jgi:hypothetical protein